MTWIHYGLNEMNIIGAFDVEINTSQEAVHIPGDMWHTEVISHLVCALHIACKNTVSIKRRLFPEWDKFGVKNARFHRDYVFKQYNMSGEDIKVHYLSLGASNTVNMLMRQLHEGDQ